MSKIASHEKKTDRENGKSHSGIPLDVHVFTPEEFDDTAYDELSFTWAIARQARLYYWS